MASPRYAGEKFESTDLLWVADRQGPRLPTSANKLFLSSPLLTYPVHLCWDRSRVFFCTPAAWVIKQRMTALNGNAHGMFLTYV